MKYWAYVNNEILGPFEKEKLLELPSFSAALLVCPQTPVGEKTEEWKEASTYPELSALLGSSNPPPAAAVPETFTPAPSVQESQAPAPSPAEPAGQPAVETPGINFKPLTASQSVEPIPPAEHAPGMTDITVNKLGKANAAPEAQQSSADFDPISLSQIVRRSETLSGAEAHAASNEGLTLEPQKSFSQPAEETPAAAPANTENSVPLPPAAEAPAAAPAMEAFKRTASGAPELETFARPAAAAPAVTDVAGLESLVRRLDALSKESATRKDISSAVDPLRIKLDQMGEVLSSIKNSQFQRDVMDKLAYLETSVGELKQSFTQQQGSGPAKAPKAEAEKSANTVFGVKPPAKAAEKPKEEPAKEPEKPAAMTDQGSKSSKVGPALQKSIKMAVTVILLVAVLLGAVIGLKNFGIFDATKFIPFPLPFIGESRQAEQPPQAGETTGEAAGEPAGEAAGEARPGQVPEQQAGDQTTPEQRAELLKTMAEKDQQAQAQEQPKQPDLAPEIIYITRTYKLSRTGQSLENKIYEHAGKAGGNYNRTSWDVKQGADGMYEISAVIPGKTDNLTYAYTVDREKKTVQPANPAGKAAFDELKKDAAKKTAARKRSKRATPRPAARPAPKPAPKKAAPKKITAPDDEYEYEYVDDDGTE
ncbi:MAG: hypothetical protein COX65_01445 [Elusimicrobia bacterium CG_4_10_14_0_2_um_filter_56_8]|nr:MAG: hypothetical protein COX65_01445 [Elusimicrobia bacterium CG_4_10_14_0_2_um_filter_56_8]